MSTTLFVGLFVGIVVWFVGWWIGANYVDGLWDAVKEVWQAGLIITSIAVLAGILVAAVGADRRWW